MSDRIRLVPMFKKFISCSLPEGGIILDVGCGALCAEFHSVYGDRYVGVDLETSPYRKDYACDAHDLSRFETDSVDVVTLWSVVEHLKEPYKALNEARRVARKAVYVTTDYTDRDKNTSPYHYYSWTQKTFTQFLKLFGKSSKTWIENDILCGVINL